MMNLEAVEPPSLRAAWRRVVLGCVAAAVPCVVLSQPAPKTASNEVAASWTQSQADDFTRYELLEPTSQSFRILYDVSATSPGTSLFFNPIRPGSTPTVHGVTDLASGKALAWKLVDGSVALADGWADANSEMRYIRVELARAVPQLSVGEGSISPAAGEARLRIDKTYRDPESYQVNGDRLTFARSLGIRRNAVVLPAGYELVRCNTPVQIDTEADGRLRLSFQSAWPGATQLELEARKIGAAELAAHAKAAPAKFGVGLSTARGQQAGAVEPGGSVQRSAPAGARVGYEFSARAGQDREIVYELLDPVSHSFRLFHDYTESRPGVDRYLNVVRAGSRASDPEAWDLDSGERLRVEQLRGVAAIRERRLDLGFAPQADTEVVAIWFDAVVRGGSRRIRIEETYTDASRYGVLPSDANTLLWDRSFGRARNAIVLPAGWRLTRNLVPATVRTLDDGRTRLDFSNDRDDEVAVLVQAVRRAPH